MKKKSKGSWESKKHRDYKYRDKKRGNEYAFSLEQSKALFRLPCFYCTRPEAKGLDRLDNDLGYSNSNIVPCCNICNTILSTLPKDAKMEMRESLRVIYEKDLLKDWKPIYLTEPKKKEDIIISSGVGVTAEDIAQEIAEIGEEDFEPDQCGVVGDALDPTAPVCYLVPNHEGSHRQISFMGIEIPYVDKHEIKSTSEVEAGPGQFEFTAPELEARVANYIKRDVDLAILNDMIDHEQSHVSLKEKANEVLHFSSSARYYRCRMCGCGNEWCSCVGYTG